jgi:hypothetical protein
MSRRNLPVLLVFAACGGSPVQPPSGDAAVDLAPPVETERRDSGVDRALLPDATAGAGPDTRALVADAASPVDGVTLVAGCPGPDAYVGNRAWRDLLVIPPGVPRLCGYWVESSGSVDPSSTANRLKDTLARKGLLSIAPGTYNLIDTDAQAAFALPICIVNRDASAMTTASGTIGRRRQGPLNIFDVALPLPGRGLLRTALVREGASPLTVTGISGFEWCLDDSRCQSFAWFGTCTVPDEPVINVVNLDGGSVEVTVAIDKLSGGLGTEAASFDRARGTFRGVAFDQRDYFKLVYSPEHHHFVRHFAVFFDAPIDGACGLELMNIPGAPRARPTRAFTVDCQLQRLGEVKVTSVTGP